MSRRPTTTGVLPLVRLVLRRDRVRLPIWIVSITLLVLFTAASVKGLYKTEAELVAGAAPMYGNAAVIALNGPTYAIDTYGGQMVFQVGSFGYVVVALMGMFLVGRHTRADEEDGRTELIRATVVGRNAPVTAVLVVAALAYTLLGGAHHALDAEPGRSGRGVDPLRRGDGRLRDVLRLPHRGDRPGDRAQPRRPRPGRRRPRRLVRAARHRRRERGRVVVAVADGVGTVHQAVRRGSVAAAARSLPSGRRRWWCLPTACRPAGTSAPGCCRLGPVRRLPRPASAGRLVWRSGCNGPASSGGRWPSLSRVWPTDRSPRTWPIWWATTTRSRSSSPKQGGASSTRSSPRRC